MSKPLLLGGTTGNPGILKTPETKPKIFMKKTISQGRIKKPRSWEKTQGVATLHAKETQMNTRIGTRLQAEVLASKKTRGEIHVQLD